ncbi:MAG: PH domain-containing protein [Gemmatimonadaceae bacterium]
MSYIESQLLPGEAIRYRGHLHRSIFAPAFIFAVLAVLSLVIVLQSGDWPLFYGLAVPAVAAYIWAQVLYTTSEFAVTNKRVVIKVGWLRRRTVETMLSKVEGINVDQSVIGRLFGYGSIIITGTGGTQEPFRNIGAPFEFRRQVQAQVSAAEDYQRSPVRPVEPAVPALPPLPPLSSTREERDCPWCAERVLARARVCKHCGREIEPLR